MVGANNSVVYCHFSYRRPKGKHYCLFAVALYRDPEWKKLIVQRTVALSMWEDQQHVTAIQSYQNALECLFQWQGTLRAHGMNNVLLVTNNSTLALWISNPKKRKEYADYMEMAVAPYRAGAKKEILLSIGMCEPVDNEKSHKFCRDELVKNNIPSEFQAREDRKEAAKNLLDIKNLRLLTVEEFLNVDKPEGMWDDKPSNPLEI